jgi:hypothetical protein
LYSQKAGGIPVFLPPKKVIAGFRGDRTAGGNLAKNRGFSKTSVFGEAVLDYLPVRRRMF